MGKQGTRRRSDRIGRAFTWLIAGILALDLLLIVGVLSLVSFHGLSTFWQHDLWRFELQDGRVLLGEVRNREEIPEAPRTASGEMPTRLRLKLGNRDLTGLDFAWIDEADIVSRDRPERAVLLERLEWGNFHGFARELRHGEKLLASGPEAVWAALPDLMAQKQEQLERIDEIEGDEIGAINRELESLRLAERRLDLEASGAPREATRRDEIQHATAQVRREYEAVAERLEAARQAFEAETLVLLAADGSPLSLPVGHVVRALRPNSLELPGRAGLYLSRVTEFLFDEPRESNTEGGIFPAIFGTVMMVFLMSFAVAPFGVLAAVYLQEYARQGPFVRLVRIAVNNLAGVPSIVFGVFGLGFFVYGIGGSIDQLFFPEALPTPTFGTGGILWASLTLALLTVPVVIVASEEGLAAVPRIVRQGSRALGATHFETLRRVVIPAAAPGIMTGLILAIARAAGEVAPLMIVGMVKLAPALPLDGTFPFVHLERKFMHLGFHIYDVGFQSPNVEAAKPLVFTTAFLLIAVVLILNLVAILVRSRLRTRYATSSV
ncbi:MAG: phosphate ABC transporter permease PstA [Myxococcota bacterium]